MKKLLRKSKNVTGKVSITVNVQSDNSKNQSTCAIQKVITEENKK